MGAEREQPPPNALALELPTLLVLAYLDDFVLQVRFILQVRKKEKRKKPREKKPVMVGGGSQQSSMTCAAAGYTRYPGADLGCAPNVSDDILEKTIVRRTSRGAPR